MAAAFRAILFDNFDFSRLFLLFLFFCDFCHLSPLKSQSASVVRSKNCKKHQKLFESIKLVDFLVVCVHKNIVGNSEIS